MFRALVIVLFCFAVVGAEAQIRVELEFSRFQYVAYEPVMARVTITNLAGRDVELQNERDRTWYGFELTADDGRVLAPVRHPQEPPLKIAAGASVSRKINLTDLFPIGEFGTYRVRANIFFADLNKFFYAQTKVFEVTSAHPIWQRTVGDPGVGGVRTYSLMTNRFPNHTSLYVRVEDRQNNLVYATYSLGRVIAFEEPRAEIDRQNQLHVLQCSAPRVWGYSVVGPNGRLLKHATYSQTHSSPRLHREDDGTVTIQGGALDSPVTPAAKDKGTPRFSNQTAKPPPED
jgi:hypothetical protein